MRTGVNIRSISKTLEGVNVAQPSVSKPRFYRRWISATIGRSRKRVIRYSILAANIFILVAVLGFVLRSSGNNKFTSASSVSNAGGSSAVVNPLDQLSSADIAVNVARMTNLPEAVAATNNADSLDSQLAISTTNATVVTKPQVADTPLKSNRDIKSYVTQSGDTVTNLATKFGVTSDTIRWSNGISGDTIATSSTIYVLPGVNGIVYVVVSGDTPDTLAAKFHASKDKIVAYNDAEIGGLKVGERIIIPDGSKTASVASSSSFSSGFAWGATAVYGNNGYDYGFCTWYVANRRAAIGRPVPSNLGNAYSWYRIALNAGLPTGFAPQVGAVAVNEAGNHVSIVEAVNGDGSFWVSEMNSRGQVSMTDPTPAGGWGRVDYKIISSVGSLKFIY
ncbi:MAG TPA: CHAP domain-containing protein [Patescibacteria group bacterium]|nr:CHAP domain-containing protein [Patescibacteria group bacterium]